MVIKGIDQKQGTNERFATKERVLSVLNHIAIQAKAPTTRRVHQILGGGSRRDVVRLVKECLKDSHLRQSMVSAAPVINDKALKRVSDVVQQFALRGIKPTIEMVRRECHLRRQTVVSAMQLLRGRIGQPPMRTIQPEEIFCIEDEDDDDDDAHDVSNNILTEDESIIPAEPGSGTNAPVISVDTVVHPISPAAGSGTISTDRQSPGMDPVSCESSARSMVVLDDPNKGTLLSAQGKSQVFVVCECAPMDTPAGRASREEHGATAQLSTPIQSPNFVMGPSSEREVHP